MTASDNREWRHEMLSIAWTCLFGDVFPSQIPSIVILPMESPDFHEGSRFSSRLSDPQVYKAVTIGTYRNTRVGVLTSKFGAPAVVMTVELLASLGVRWILGIGYCGAFQENVECRDIVLPYACVRDDGTSTKYVDKGYPAVADISMLDVLREGVRGAGVRWHCGVILSTDAVLLESSAWVNEWSSRGITGVDMESGALFTLARLLKKAAACILVASDNPRRGLHPDRDKLTAGLDKALDLAFNSVPLL